MSTVALEFLHRSGSRDTVCLEGKIEAMLSSIICKIEDMPISHNKEVYVGVVWMVARPMDIIGLWDYGKVNLSNSSLLQCNPSAMTVQRKERSVLASDTDCVLQNSSC